jgi:flagellar hook-associated protein 3
MSSWATIFNNTNAAMRIQSTALARLQEQMSTGARVIRPSDDPADAFQILSLRARSSSLQAMMSNLDASSSNMTAAHTALMEMSGKLAASGEGSISAMLSQAASGVLNSDLRSAMAQGVDTIIEYLASMANTDVLGQYVFGGSKASRPPYEIIRDADGRITSVEYRGGRDEMTTSVGPGVNGAMTLVGDSVLRSDNRQPPEFLGTTGATAGSGTNSARGDVWLTLAHTSSDYEAGSGLTQGTGASADTILGEHTVHVDGPAGVIRLDDGQAVAFDGSETNLQLTNAAGDVVHVDASVFNMSAAGSYAVIGNGTMSIDDGASTVAIDFSDANQAVVDSATGRTLHVNSGGIAREGVEPVRIPGTYDLFGALLNVRDLMLNAHGLTDERQRELISQALATVQEVERQITSKAASVGSRIQALQSLSNGLEDLKAANDDNAANLEDADAIQVAIDLARTQTLYEMSLATASRMLSVSLLDYI